MMSRRFPIYALIALLSLNLHTAFSEESAILPVDANTSVIEMWYVHASRPSHPEVIVLADGRMQIMSPEGPQRTQLEVDQVKALLNALLHHDGLVDVENQTLHHDVKRATVETGLSSCIEGAGDTVIRLRTADRQFELRCPAVGILAVRFPQVAGVKAMAAAQRRLENVRAVATVGGSKEAEYIAEMAAQAVQSEYGVSLPVSKNDLSMVRALPDGSRFCQFVVAMNESSSDSLHMISVTETPGHRPVVYMIGDSAVR